MKHPIIIVDYDSHWPILYEEEKDRILGVIGDKIVAIEHIGSTAVPGLGAKPIIDIMIGVRHLADANECIKPLQSIGYEYVPEYEVSIPERRFFRKGPLEARIHLHMVERSSDFWERHILFRDFLRAHPEIAQQYYQLKKELAARFGSDRDAYTAAKTPFIESVIAMACAAKRPAPTDCGCKRSYN